VDGEAVVLKKHQTACVFCENAKDIVVYKGKNVCGACLRDMAEMK